MPVAPGASGFYLSLGWKKVVRVKGFPSKGFGLGVWGFLMAASIVRRRWGWSDSSHSGEQRELSRLRGPGAKPGSTIWSRI